MVEINRPAIPRAGCSQTPLVSGLSGFAASRGPVQGREVGIRDPSSGAGRLSSLEIVLDDSSVSRRHAEVRLADAGVGRPRPGKHQRHLRQRRPPRPAATSRSSPATSSSSARSPCWSSRRRRRPTARRRTSSCSRRPPDRPSRTGCGGSRSTGNSCPGPGDQLIALLRAGHHLVHIESEDQLLDSILNDAVRCSTPSGGDRAGRGTGRSRS